MNALQQGILKNKNNQKMVFIDGFVGTWARFGNDFGDLEHKEVLVLDDRKRATLFVLRFMAYWISFTALLDMRYTNQYIYDHNQKKIVKQRKIMSHGKYVYPNLTETQRIDLFFADKYFKDCCDEFQAMEAEGADVFKEPIYKIKHRNPSMAKDPCYSDIINGFFAGERDINECNSAVIKSIYVARNNLVHGEKELNDRDVDILIAASNVMEILLKLVVAHGKQYDYGFYPKM